MPTEEPEFTPKIRVKYFRLPNQVMELYGTLIYRSEKVIVLESQITSSHSIVFDGEMVLARGYQIVVFELMGKWFSIGKIRNLQGRHTGYYCDVVTPPRIVEDGGVELTDLFLDLWVSPDLRYKVLDEEEFKNAFRKGWITEKVYNKAREELEKLIGVVKQGKFPPYAIEHLEAEFHL